MDARKSAKLTGEGEAHKETSAKLTTQSETLDEGLLVGCDVRTYATRFHPFWLVVNFGTMVNVECLG